MRAEKRQTILIVDNSERSRAIPADMPAGEYALIEAESGLQGAELLRQQGTGISPVLLNGGTPEADGSFAEQIYAPGASDVVSRPFHQLTFRRRTASLINKLYVKQGHLSSLAAEQTHENGPRGSAQDKEIPL